MISAGFAPHVEHKGGNAGDEHTKKLYELFAKVAETEKAARQAQYATGEAENQARLARERQARAELLFKAAKRELANELGDGPAPEGS